MANITNIWEEIISWIISHLGINPVKGGNPPRDKRDENVNIFIWEEWEEWFKIWEIWKASW